MAVVEVNQLWEGEGGSDTILRKRDYTLIFEVLCDDPGDDATVAGGPTARALGLPGNGYPYPLDSYALCTGVQPQRSAESPTRWIVTCTYSTELPKQQAQETQGFNDTTGDSQQTPTGADPTSRPEHPLDRDPKYSVTHEKFTEPVTHTWQNIPILNCADDPYDPPIEVQRSLAVITQTRNYAIAKFDWLDQFVGSVNSVRWKGRKKRTCRIDEIGYVAKQENGVQFFEVTFRIIVNPRTWDFFVMERGWNYKKNVAGTWTKTPIPVPVDDSGRHSNDVPKLDGARASGATYSSDYVAADDGTVGGPKDGSNPTIPDVSYPSTDNDGTKGRGQVQGAALSPVYTRWRIYPEKAFSLLNL